MIARKLIEKSDKLRDEAIATDSEKKATVKACLSGALEGLVDGLIVGAGTGILMSIGLAFLGKIKK